MNDREKLIELLGHLEYQYCQSHSIMRENVVDYLLSHGVTIREPGEQSDDDCFREKMEHQLKGIYEHLREIDGAIDTLRAQTLPLRENIIPWFTESNMHNNVVGSECHCGAPMKGESK